MAASMNQIDDKWMDARLAILERIAKDVQDGSASSYIKELAEAYAWLTSVEQPH